MSYADGFVIVIPTKNIEAYRGMSEKAGRVWMEHGALDYKECVGEDLTPQGALSTFPDKLHAKKNETIVFSWILYKSRKHRDDVLKKVMADKRIADSMKEKCPFDPARMLYGGFDAIVDLSPKPAAVKKAKAKKKKVAKRA